MVRRASGQWLAGCSRAGLCCGPAPWSHRSDLRLRSECIIIYLFGPFLCPFLSYDFILFSFIFLSFTRCIGFFGGVERQRGHCTEHDYFIYFLFFRFDSLVYLKKRENWFPWFFLEDLSTGYTSSILIKFDKYLTAWERATNNPESFIYLKQNKF